MNSSLSLLRDVSHMLIFFSGAYAATYGWWFLLLFIPSVALTLWINGRIDRLISTAMQLAIKNAHKSEPKT